MRYGKPLVGQTTRTSASGVVPRLADENAAGNSDKNVFCATCGQRPALVRTRLHSRAYFRQVSHHVLRREGFAHDTAPQTTALEQVCLFDSNQFATTPTRTWT